MYTDTHFHYQEMRKKEFSHEYITGLFTEGKLRMGIDIGIHGNRDFPERHEMLAGVSNVYFTVGFHPSTTGSIAADTVHTALFPLLSHPRVVAVGEIGMDFHWDFGSEQEQADLFQAQIACANATGLPVIIHNRKAMKNIKQVLREHPPQAGGIMHCFEGDSEDAQAFLDLGMHISFAGNLTFKRNTMLRETLRYIPESRLLLETDSPYLTPEPMRGRPNHPGLIAHIYETAATLRETSVDNLAESVFRNARQLFRISE